MSTQATMDNRTFTSNTAVRTAFTESELQAARTLTSLSDGQIGTDIRYGNAGISNQLNIDRALYSGDFHRYEGIPIIVREEISKYPFNVFRNFIKLNYDPYQALEQQGFDRFYDCGAVTGFIKLAGNVN